MNAPGGNTNSNTLHVSGSSDVPNSEPAPIISRTAPSRVRAMVKPNPMPMPSQMLARGLFLQAKASARPRITQLTTMSGM